MARSDYASLTRDELLTVIERLEARIAQQDAHILRLEARIKHLEDLLDQATRGGKRQAAPFSKGGPNRKVFGGNRTPAGAQALEVLASIFATCRQHGRDALRYLSSLLRLSPASDPVAIPLPLPV